MSAVTFNDCDIKEILQNQVDAFFLRTAEETEDDWRKRRQPSVKVRVCYCKTIWQD